MRKALISLGFIFLFFVLLNFYLLILEGLLEGKVLEAEKALSMVRIVVFGLFLTQLIIALLYLWIQKVNGDAFFSIVIVKEITWFYWLLLLGIYQVFPLMFFETNAICLRDAFWCALIASSTILMFLFEAAFINRFNLGMIGYRNALLLSVLMNIGGLFGAVLIVASFSV